MAQEPVDQYEVLLRPRRRHRELDEVEVCFGLQALRRQKLDVRIADDRRVEGLVATAARGRGARALRTDAGLRENRRPPAVIGVDCVGIPRNAMRRAAAVIAKTTAKRRQDRRRRWCPEEERGHITSLSSVLGSSCPTRPITTSATVIEVGSTWFSIVEELIGPRAYQSTAAKGTHTQSHEINSRRIPYPSPRPNFDAQGDSGHLRRETR